MPAMHREPLRSPPGVTGKKAAFTATSRGVTLRSSLLRAQAPDQNPPTAFGLGFGRWVFAGCCQPLLGDGPSRRYLCESFPRCLDPYPGGFPRCSRPFLPGETSAFPALGPGRLPTSPRTGDFRARIISGLQSFANVQAPGFARHSGRPYYVQPPRSSSGFSVRASLGSLPPRAPDMLAVRTGQLTAGDFHPIESAAVSAAPLTNMRFTCAATSAPVYRAARPLNIAREQSMANTPNRTRVSCIRGLDGSHPNASATDPQV
jgi:hypothetical protein